MGKSKKDKSKNKKKKVNYEGFYEDEKKTIKFFTGFYIIQGMIIAGISLTAYDSLCDHTKILCPFVKVLGPEHQARKINNSHKYLKDGYHATVTTDDIKPVYMAPEGTLLIGDKCYKIHGNPVAVNSENLNTGDDYVTIGEQLYKKEDVDISNAYVTYQKEENPEGKKKILVYKGTQINNVFPID